MPSRPAQRGNTTPLYIVCSPFRGVGKTLIARLLAEFYSIDARPVAAFDLADESPQLVDYLPQLATVADIGDARGQMALFDRIIANNSAITIIDLGYRAFTNFFGIVQKIGFFEEARRYSIEPLVLFIAGPDPKSPKAYELLRRWLPRAALFPIRNKSNALPGDVATSARMDALEIGLLHFSLRARIDRTSFSFGAFWQGMADDCCDASKDELLTWMEHAFLQFQSLEFSLGRNDVPTRVAASRVTIRPSYPGLQRKERHLGGDAWRDAGSAAAKFAQNQTRAIHSVTMDQPGNVIVAMLQKAGSRLRAAQARIDQLEAEVENCRDRASRAEAWLRLIESEIVNRASRSTRIREAGRACFKHEVTDAIG